MQTLCSKSYISRPVMSSCAPHSSSTRLHCSVKAVFHHLGSSTLAQPEDEKWKAEGLARLNGIFVLCEHNYFVRSCS